MKKLVRLVPIHLIIMIILGGCHLEQGKLHFDKLNLNPITVYKMNSLETAIYCLAEGDIPSGDVFNEMHRQSLEQVESYPESTNWGELVCLSLSESASIKQMEDTINVLLLVLTIRHELHDALRGFRNLLGQRINLIEEVMAGQALLEDEKAQSENVNKDYEEKLETQKQIIIKLEISIGELEQQVQKLKEVELLLQPNKTTQ